MCRSIRVLRTPEGTAADEEVRAAALQFVRKVSGFRSPSERNREAFESAVEGVAAATRRLLADLPPRRVVAPESASPGSEERWA